MRLLGSVLLVVCCFALASNASKMTSFDLNDLSFITNDQEATSDVEIPLQTSGDKNTDAAKYEINTDETDAGNTLKYSHVDSDSSSVLTDPEGLVVSVHGPPGGNETSRRHKRQLGASPVAAPLAYTDEEKQRVLDHHNMLRRRETGASNMRRLVSYQSSSVEFFWHLHSSLVVFLAMMYT